MFTFGNEQGESELCEEDRKLQKKSFEKRMKRVLYAFAKRACTYIA